MQPASGGWDGEMEVLNRTRGRTFLRKLIHRNDHFAASSQQIADELRKNGIADETISLTNSGVDIDRFSCAQTSLFSDLLCNRTAFKFKCLGTFKRPTINLKPTYLISFIILPIANKVRSQKDFR